MLTARGWRCQPFELSEAEKRTLLRMLVRGPRRAGPHPGSLDLRTGGRVVPSGVRIRYHPSRIPEGADRTRLEVPAAHARWCGTRRGGHRPVGVGRMALD